MHVLWKVFQVWETTVHQFHLMFLQRHDSLHQFLLNVPSEIWFIMSPDEWIFWGNVIQVHILVPIFLQAASNSFSFIEILFLYTHEDFAVRSKHLQHEWLITSNSILCDVITYTCPKYMLLTPISSYYSVWCNYLYMPQIPASSRKVLIYIVPNSEWWSLSIIAVASEDSKNSYTWHILSSLTWVVWIMNFMSPIAVYFWTKNLFLETWQFSHLCVTSNTSVPGSGSIQSAENLPNVSHTKNLKVSVIVMNWTENNVQLSQFMLGSGRTYITINIIWILDKRTDCKICVTCHKTFWNSSASTIMLFQEALKF